MLLGRSDNGQLQVPPQLVIIVDEGEVSRNAFLDGGLGQPLGAPSAVGLVRDLFADLRHVVLPGRLLNMRQQWRPFAQERHAAPQPVAGCSPGRGLDIGLGEHPAAQEQRDFLSIHRIVCGLPAMESLHGEGMAQDTGDTFTSAEVGQPIPGEETLGAPNQPLAVGCNDLEKRGGASGHIPGHQNRAILVQNTDVQGAGMQVEAAVKLRLFGVASHAVSSSLESAFSHSQHTIGVC
jgi:hypothetical protein